MKRLNIKLAVFLLIGFVVLGLGVHLLHAFQVDRNAEGLLEQAQALREKGDLEEAFQTAWRYKNLRNEDVPGSKLVADIAFDIAESDGATRRKKWIAINEMERALRLDSEDAERRRKLLDYYVKNGWITSAIDHVKLLRNPTKLDPELEIIAAKCYAATADYTEAAKICRALIGYEANQTFSENPPGKSNVMAYALLADLMREKQQGNESQADQVIGKLIELNGESSEAQLAAHGYWKRNKNDEQAKQSLERAYEIDPESPEVALLKAEQAIDDKRLDDAEQLLSAALDKHPDAAMVYKYLAIVEQRRQRPDEALKVLQDGLKRLPDSEHLLEYLVGVHLDRGSVEDAKAAYKQLKELGLTESAYDYFEGRFLVGEKKWAEAIERLTKARSKLLNNPHVVAQIDTYLGQCYQQLGDPKKAEEALSRAAENAAGVSQADLALAQVWAATGRRAQSLQKYEEIAAKLESRAFDFQYVWQPLLELRNWDQTRQPKEKRDWSKVEELVTQLNQAGKIDPITNVILQGDVLSNKGELEEARTLYTTALHANPNNEAIWMARLRLELEASGPEKALRLAEQVPPAIENGALVRLVRASIFAQMPGETGKAGLLSVERGMERLGASDQLRLLHGLVLEYRKLGDRESARRLLSQMMSKWEKDFFSRNMMFEMAREDSDIKTMERMAAELRKISEPSSPYPSVFEAVTKITAVTAAQRAMVKETGAQEFKLTNEQKRSLEQARALLEKVAKSHSSWNEPHKWLAEIHALHNNADGMLAELETALSEGSLDAARTRQLYKLLVAKGRNADAEKVYQSLSGEKREGTEWSQISILIQEKRFPEARALLDTMEPKADSTLDELLTYADARRRTGDLPKAEAALRQAVQLDSSSAHAWVFLVNTLVSAGKQSDAEAAVESAKERVPAAERELVLAQCYEALRDPKRAEQSYLKALGEKPKDLLTNQAIGSFYLRTNRRAEAMKYLDTIQSQGAAATSPTDKEIVSWAKRGRAVAIAADGNWQRFKEAEALLLKNEEEIRQSGKEPDPAHLLLRIALLADRQEPVSIRAALSLFEELQRRQPLQTSEMVNFARQYERVGEWAKAKDLMLKVLAAPNPEALHFLGYAEMLIRNSEYSDADFWLNRYDRVRTDGASVPIRVKLRVKQGKEKEAVALLKNAIGPPRWSAERLPQVRHAGSLLHQLRQYADAEIIWRGYMQTEPSGIIMLATTVGMHRDLDEAMKLLEASLKYHPPRDVLLVGMEILRVRKADAEDKHFTDLGRWYKAALATAPNDPQLQMLIGDMWEIRGKLDLAEQQYRKVLSRTDLDPMTRAHIGNNLAFILSTQRKNTDEAVELIDKAMEVYGPSSDLLDTRGVVYLAADKPDKAEADFREAVLIPSAMKWVHLAFAQSALKKQEGARQSLKKAQEMDLKRQDLYEAEWTRYERLSRDLGLQADATP